MNEIFLLIGNGSDLYYKLPIKCMDLFDILGKNFVIKQTVIENVKFVEQGSAV